MVQARKRRLRETEFATPHPTAEKGQNAAPSNSSALTSAASREAHIQASPTYPHAAALHTMYTEISTETRAPHPVLPTHSAKGTQAWTHMQIRNTAWISDLGGFFFLGKRVREGND